MSARERIYSEVIRKLALVGKAGRMLDQDPHAECRLRNPMCGDEVSMSIFRSTDGGLSMGYSARGCLLCLAACAKAESIVVSETYPKNIKTLLFPALGMFSGGVWSEATSEFEPVRIRRSRHECVLLPFKALNRLLQDVENPRIDTNPRLGLDKQ